jgi:hypothetical protein
MGATIFYSWQSDLRAAACRTLIQASLEAAARRIAGDVALGVEPVIDRDTENVPGAPDIGATILARIDAAAVFVADVSIVGRTSSDKATPNPNVLVELGYALKGLGAERIILVQNTAFGGPEELPFDLRQKRAVKYASAADADERASERKQLQAQLEAALRSILSAPTPHLPGPDVDLTLDYEKKRITPDYHL